MQAISLLIMHSSSLPRGLNKDSDSDQQFPCGIIRSVKPKDVSVSWLHHSVDDVVGDCTWRRWKELLIY